MIQIQFRHVRLIPMLAGIKRLIIGQSVVLIPKFFIRTLTTDLGANVSTNNEI